MVNCTFCGIAIPRGTGKMFVKVDGKILYFCSTKCEKNNNKLGRKARNFKWTAEFKKSKQR